MKSLGLLRFSIVCLGLCLSIPTIYAQSRLGEQQLGERRVALVIGMKDYANLKPLKNPINDANDMEQALKKLNFQVTKFTDAETKTLRYGIDRFVAGLRENDVVVVYYSGHGVGFEGDNYLLPIDANPRCRETVSYEGISTNKFMTDVELRNAKNVFVIFDACRSLLDGKNLESCETGKSINSQSGWEIPKNNPKGSIMVLATSAGKISDDNIAGRNGLFTEGLLKHITTPNLTFEQIFKLAAKQTATKSQGKQLPVIALNTVYDDFVFIKTNTPTPKDNFTPTTNTTKKFMDLPFAEMAFIKGGTFEMESNESEKPIHTITVSDFWMGKYEVTQYQWKYIMGKSPSRVKDCEECPVEEVSWADVKKFLKKLNARTGENYRLPTEAEWRYAAGGGSGVLTQDVNMSEIADTSNINIGGRKVNEIHKVGSFNPNKLGLFDMRGNVWEWCSGFYGQNFSEESPSINPTEAGTGVKLVVRGGSQYHFGPLWSRVNLYGGYSPTDRGSNIGFRVVVSH